MLSIPHLILIFLVVLIVFGPEKLPELARTLSKAMIEFRRATGGLRETLEQEMQQLEREVDDRRAPRPTSADALPATTPASEVAEQAADEAPSAAVPPAAVTASEETVRPSSPPESPAERPADGHPTAA